MGNTGGPITGGPGNHEHSWYSGQGISTPWQLGQNSETLPQRRRAARSRRAQPILARHTSLEDPVTLVEMTEQRKTASTQETPEEYTRLNVLASIELLSRNSKSEKSDEDLIYETSGNYTFF